jgi:triosephosphate isomerase
MVAYEPIWAIGTGVAATPEEAQLNMEYLRACLEKKYGIESGRKIPLLYGGSVTKENVSKFLYQQDIDGTLIGQASVDPDSFVNIVTQAAKLV